jgi:hypothetical protein
MDISVAKESTMSEAMRATMRETQRVRTAAALAGEAILLEIGAGYGVIDAIRVSKPFSPDDLAEVSNLPAPVMNSYLQALESAGLVIGVDGAGTSFRASPVFDEAIHDVGFISWGLRACEPLINHAREFAQDLPQSFANYARDGGLIARTSKWMGEEAFYPQAEKTIISLRPKKIVDLGAGSAGLLVRCLKELPEASGVAIDMSPEACDAAENAIRAAGMPHRVSVVRMKLQELATESSCLQDADVFHAGFVLHDLVPDDEDALTGLLAACRRANTASTFLVVDGIPYAQDPSERAFSAAFTFLHRSFMGRLIQTEQQWIDRLTTAGFARIKVTPLGIPGGRLFCAHTN